LARRMPWGYIQIHAIVSSLDLDLFMHTDTTVKGLIDLNPDRACAQRCRGGGGVGQAYAVELNIDRFGFYYIISLDLCVYVCTYNAKSPAPRPRVCPARRRRR